MEFSWKCVEGISDPPRPSTSLLAALRRYAILRTTATAHPDARYRTTVAQSTKGLL